MFNEPIDVVIFILGCLVLLTALMSMQAKKIYYIVILQSVSNGFAIVQYALRNQMSSVLICALGAILTLIIFFYDKKEKHVPALLIALFTVAGIALTLSTAFMNGGFRPGSDIVPILAWIVFNLAMMQSKSWIARVLMMLNSTLWLLLNIINFDLSLTITYSVIIITAIVGIIRHDRGEWRAFFSRLFGARSDCDGEKEVISEKSEENV